jgi:Lrp/AsnC family leucine-responsive transcriptional regulator
LDQIDWSILRELQADARLSYAQLGKRVNLSSPAVAERVRRLERDGVITGYQVKVDAAKVGAPVSAFVELTCEQGKCLLRTSKSEDYPEIVEVHKLGGDHCSMLRLRATSIAHLDSALEQISRHGQVRASVVLSTQYEGRPVEPARQDFVPATPSEGWRSC